MHPLCHKVLDIPARIPLVIPVHGSLGSGICAGFDLHPVIVAQVTFAGDVGEEMADVGKVRLLGTNIAM